MTAIRTDVELGRFLATQSRAYLDCWLQVCDGLASGEEDVSHYEILAGAARAALRGEDPVAFQRSAAGVVNGFYEEDCR
jgi:hypothetical protein